ncbi:pikachurin-like [Schistocerca gregaria]|uniref:pikachurin-like n=1 Tax=Schistocerca gregaria TaxID=7010 RepID=UPI00211DC70B|nr:pikachurin-like [Schistocerca gregaria]
MVMKMGDMERVPSRLLFLCVLFVGYTRSAVQQADVQNSLFEAAFQGRCGRGSPCEQLCYELHDGMFECDCRPGYELHRNGYSCLEMNTTDSSLAGVHGPLVAPLAAGDRDEDVLYQKDASFSAELAAGPVPAPAVSFVGDALQPQPQPQPLAAGSTAASTTPTPTPTTAAPCTLDCGSGGTCVQPAEGSPPGQRCQCPLGRGGPRCETEVEVRSPRFSGQSWLAFPALRAAYKHVQLSVEFRPEAADGILFLTGERDDMAGDFMALLLHAGYVEFRFDCGSGLGVVRSEETVQLNQWNRVTLYRHRWDAWLQLNKGRRVEGRSKGLFSRITFREPLFVGGPGNTTGLADKLPTEEGLRGCVRRLIVNDRLYSFGLAPAGDAVKGFDVEECGGDGCSLISCQHGGKCLATGDSAVCLCPLGYQGDYCETRIDLQVPAFNGSSYLRYPGLGGSALSWLDLQITLKPAAPDGVLLYNGHRADGVGDFMAVYMTGGHLEFAFDLGTGAATIRSGAPLSLGQWHEAVVSRTGRLAVLQVDDRPPTQATAPGAFTQMTLPQNLYIGGVPNFDMVSPKVKVRTSFVGCIQKVVLNDQPLAVVAAALAGVNVANCAHPCSARPCGPAARCVPARERFTCDCSPGRCRPRDPNPAPRFSGTSYLHFGDADTVRRIVSYKVNINMRFRTGVPEGVLLWSGRRDASSAADFLALGVADGFLHLRFNLGSGEVDIVYNATRVDDNLWHRVKAIRNEQEGSITVDNGPTIIKRSPGKLRQLNTNTGLYIGGMEDIERETHGKYRVGLVGCISDLILDADYRVKLVEMSTSGWGIERCN